MKLDPKSEQRIHVSETPQETALYQQHERKHNKHFSTLWILAIILFFLFWVSLFFTVPYQQFHVYPAWWFEHIRERFTQFYLFLQGKVPSFGITIYQYFAVMLVGAALAACGAVFQGSFRNVLAGPSTMGVMSGGSLGCLAYLLLFTTSTTEAVATTADLAGYYQRSFLETYTQQICVLVGCFAAVAVVLVVATVAGRGKVSASAMILSGTVLSSITTNIMMVVQYYMIIKDPTDTRIDALADMMMGTFDNITTLRDVILMGIPIAICLGIILAVSGRLNLLSLGEDEAATMGLNVRFYRYLMIALGTVLTAVVVAFCGRIGFLGFMIPLVGRKLVGPDMRKLVPCALLLGAILLMLVFDAAYIAGMTSYLSLFTSSIGGIVMVVTIVRQKGGNANAA